MMKNQRIEMIKLASNTVFAGHRLNTLPNCFQMADDKESNLSQTQANGTTSKKNGSKAMKSMDIKNMNITKLKSQTRAFSASTLMGLILTAALTLGFTTGCEDKIVAIDEAPPAPQGVFTVRGDNQVFIYWLPVEASDFDHYNIYYGDDSSNGTIFSPLGSSTTEDFTDTVVSNGTRYYYAVTAVDRAGNESLESAEWGGATPRLQGNDILLVMNDNPANSGYNFASESSVAFDSPAADFWIDRDDLTDVLYINADAIENPDIGDIQDMGFTSDLDEIGRAPLSGWSALGYSELILDHTYIIWTQDDRYAKVRIESVNSSNTVVIFDYAYQSGSNVEDNGGEPELVAPNGDIIDASTYDRSTGAHRTDFSTRPKAAKVSSIQ